MCGIVGGVAKRDIEKLLIDSLKQLEYRGYDSAGIAVIDENHSLQRLRAKGKVKELENSLKNSFLRGTTGIAHTRWATHGIPSEHNAHPLISSEFAVVHNGIIENHDVLRQQLIEKGYIFTSETDTEIVVHLLHYHYSKLNDLLSATHATVCELKGAYALGIISSNYPNRLIAVRQGSPLIIGLGIGETFVASDPLALLQVTRQFIYLEDNDIADLTAEKFSIYSNKQLVERKSHILEINVDLIERGQHQHFMSKEIAEQPVAIANCLDGRVITSKISSSAFGISAEKVFQQAQQVHIIACGTSYHASLVAKYWIESLSGIPCNVEIASEFRYRNPVVKPDTLFICLSQSGETADTLAALRLAKKTGYLSTLAICNVPESSLVREADLHFMTRAGVEIGVASTKAFTTQLTALLMLTISLGRQHGLTTEVENQLTTELQDLPKILEKTLEIEPSIIALATRFIDKKHALYLGRGSLFPIALEGALKLKEISYIHAEGYPAGELKHGPLALVDKNMPVIAIAPNNEIFEKMKSNLSEVQARGGELYIFTDSIAEFEGFSQAHVVGLPRINSVFAPIIYTVPLQLLAYHVAVLKGTDVDQPRNLAKSVTVE